MSEQKSILQMLKDGIITVDEADSLLNSVRGERNSKFCPRHKAELLSDVKEKALNALKSFDERFSDIGAGVGTVLRSSLRAAEREIGKKMKKEEHDDE